MAERYDIIVRGARVIDASLALDGPADIAVAGGRIARVGDLAGAQAARVIDARGLVASAGWIDLHVHCVEGPSVGGVDPDRDAGVATGVTTIVDTGSIGADGLPLFLDVARRARTRVLGYLNVSATRGSPIHGDWQAFDQARTIAAAEAHRDLIVGIKVLASQRHCGNLGIIPVQLAAQASREARTGLMVHIGVAPPVIQDVLNLLGPGDVVTHCLKGFPGGLMSRRGFPLAEAWAAASRGVRFDVGHGSGSFCFTAARQALAAAFPIHSISTDLHGLSVKGPVYTLGRTMAKFLHLGLALPDVVRLVTVGPASIVGRADDFGTLRPGACADVTVFRVTEGPIAYTDSHGVTEQGNVDLVPACTVRAGAVVQEAW
ncbi:MAG TPA: amidohydrolase/deacetylase family metallohydrolase [bacterium]|nr:amidohydrolase/deacetylase family metallohydrolase [bacterium]